MDAMARRLDVQGELFKEMAKDIPGFQEKMKEKEELAAAREESIRMEAEAEAARKAAEEAAKNTAVPADEEMRSPGRESVPGRESFPSSPCSPGGVSAKADSDL